jgi:hypothetical protein
MPKARILVCGGRDFNDRNLLINTLDRLCDERGWNMEPAPDGNYLPDVLIISGKARGADTLAIDWAVVNWQPVEEYPAQWDQYGKRAGYIRNQQMLDEGKPDIVVAFPGGRGTAMMVDIARKAGVEVIEVS